MNEFTHYIYRHIRSDTNEVFYVGKGAFRRGRKKRYERAFIMHSNPHWMRIVNVAGREVEIMLLCQSDSEAQQKEREFILLYGRRDIGTGTLVNFTDGGDGHSGIVASDSLRKKRSVNARSKRSQAWVRSMRAARKDGGNGGVVKYGDKLPGWWRDKISNSVSGSKNHRYGKRGCGPSRSVINTATGDIFKSATEAAESAGMSMKTLYNMLSGHRKNKTDFSFSK